MNFHLLFIQLKLNNDIEVFFSVIPLLTSIALEVFTVKWWNDTASKHGPVRAHASFSAC